MPYGSTSIFTGVEVSWILYVDDIRNPRDGKDWTIARTVEDAKRLILQNGCPAFISFDHDIDENATGYDLAKWLVEMDLDGAVDIPDRFDYYVHSANTVGAANIDGVMKSYLRQKRAK